ncbi:sensor histidine kinase [Aquimarina aquimarini]|uniref:sensor histidine kinase n=1 Tax=Aquimarina aquimarini TaxID=1191734 RepID=UPI000D54B493|nr:sensor histidine kinase [Aquimarina aquimarini]
MKRLKTFIKQPLITHILFWVCVLLYFVLSASMNVHSSYRQVIDFNVMVVIVQIISAYTCIYILIPKFLNQKKIVLFIVSLIILILAMYALYGLYKIYYYDPKYIEFYSEIAKKYAQVPFLKRFSNFSVILSKAIKFLTPTVLLLMASFYKNQQQFLKLSEQKKIAELNALKHQLNPHFLFNTLNNLYALALEKSDKTPEVIERLSDILDYMLYRCKDKFVVLAKEVELLENYLALEKIRYGNRVAISFKTSIDTDARIAPLVLLTFIENAFKHGVSQELKKATINIDLSTQDKTILFLITNTKPNTYNEVKNKVDALGLNNIKKQLELLYPNTHDLQILDTENQYELSLTLKQP